MAFKKWVFRELVTDEKDYLGLLAYTCYKLEKDNLAQDLRDAGNSEEYVAEALEKFHDASVTKSQLQEFRDKGLGVMAALTEELDAALISKHADDIQVLKKHHQTAIKNKDVAYIKAIEQAVKTARSDVKKDILSKMQAYPLANVSFLKQSLKWVFNGFQSVVAVFILIFSLHALAYWTSDDATKSGVISSFWGRVQNMFTSPIPSANVTSSTGK